MRRLPIRKLLRISWRERLLLLEAVGWLALARLALLIVPFRRIAPRLGRTTGDTLPDDPRSEQVGQQIARAVQVASRYTPWETKCLAQAMAGKAMLRLRRVPSTLYLGLAKDEAGQLEAHAWLRCGSRVLTGESARERFTVVAKFAE